MTKLRTLTFCAFTITAASAALLSGCAATYKEPTSTAPDTTQEIKGSAAVLIRATKQVLVSEGFQITNSDDAAGVVSSAPRETRLTPDVADCGTTMGIDYLKDNRTSGKLGYGVLVSDNTVKVKATMSATYLPGDTSQSITLTCVSKGVLERRMLASIASAVSK